MMWLMLEEQTPPNKLEQQKNQDKEKIFEQFRQERLKIIFEGITKLVKNEKLQRLVSGVVNMTVGSYFKLSVEAFNGKTVEGQKLTPYGRAMDAVIIASGLGSYLAMALGKPELAGVSYATSWATWLLMYGSDTLGTVLTAAAEKMTAEQQNVAKFFIAVSQLLQQSKNIYIESSDDTN